MKSFGVALSVALGAITIASSAFADEMGTPMPMGHEAMGGKQVTLTGTVTDISCFTSAGLHGAGHKACAKACLLNGQPFAIMTADGNLVTILGKGPNDNPYKKIVPFLEEKVTVTGTEFSRQGANSIQIDTIQAAQ
jgi:hypothetical protein